VRRGELGEHHWKHSRNAPKKQIYGHKKPRLWGNLVKVEPHKVAQSRLEIWRVLGSVVGFIQESRFG